jgi:hypothetical protein
MYIYLFSYTSPQTWAERRISLYYTLAGSLYLPSPRQPILKTKTSKVAKITNIYSKDHHQERRERDDVRAINCEE